MAGGACKSEVETTVDGEHRPGFTEAEFLDPENCGVHFVLCLMEQLQKKK